VVRRRKHWGQGKCSAKKHATSHPAIRFECLQRLIQFETKDCIYFCIGSSPEGRIFSKTLSGAETAKGKGSQLPGGGGTGTHVSSLSHQCI